MPNKQTPPPPLQTDLAFTLLKRGICNSVQFQISSFVRNIISTRKINLLLKIKYLLIQSIYEYFLYVSKDLVEENLVNIHRKSRTRYTYTRIYICIYLPNEFAFRKSVEERRGEERSLCLLN